MCCFYQFHSIIIFQYLSDWPLPCYHAVYRATHLDIDSLPLPANIVVLVFVFLFQYCSIADYIFSPDIPNCDIIVHGH